ncbi:hypothetical protein BGZ51_008528 [Haplosporangium sp. Z 767]|nr:hypothetical protein BGZ51_008528 [Haplosporangium sp. Z 767]KAF9196840.1 hypothetical protein BGZ50_005914 [Haplosporangium sp. Z 11]
MDTNWDINANITPRGHNSTTTTTVTSWNRPTKTKTKTKTKTATNIFYRSYCVEQGAYSGLAYGSVYGLGTPLPPPPAPPLSALKRIGPNLKSTEKPPKKNRLEPLSKSDTQPSGSPITSSWSSSLKSRTMTPKRLQLVTTQMQVLQETLRELLDIAASCMESPNQNENSQQEQKPLPSSSASSSGQVLAIEDHKDGPNTTQKETADSTLMPSLSPQENERDQVLKMALLEAEHCKAELSELHAELTPHNLRNIIKKLEKDRRQQVADSERKGPKNSQGSKKTSTKGKQKRQDITGEQWTQLHGEANCNRDGQVSNSQDKKERKHALGADKKKRSEKEDTRVSAEEDEIYVLTKEPVILKNRKQERETHVFSGKNMETVDGNHKEEARAKIMTGNDEHLDKGKQVDRGAPPVNEIKTEQATGSGNQKMTANGRDDDKVKDEVKSKVKRKNNENMLELDHDIGDDVMPQSKTKGLMMELQDRIDKSIGIVNTMFEQKTSGRHIMMESCPEDETQRLNKILATAYVNEFRKLIKKAEKMIQVLSKYERGMPQKGSAMLLQSKNGTRSVSEELKDVQSHCDQFVVAPGATEEAIIPEDLAAPAEPTSDLWAAYLAL